MYLFVRRLKKEDRTRRYSIQSTATGWELREEADAETLRHAFYHDWHRVERALLNITLKVDVLRAEGWQEA